MHMGKALNQMRSALGQKLRRGRVHIGLWAAIAVVAAGLGFVLWGGLASTDSSITVTQGDFELTCPTGTVAENATLECTLENTAAEAKPWPVVAILHLSTDDDRALVRGTDIDVTLGAPSPTADIDGGVTWIGDTLVGYSRFDWSGNASAESSRTVNIVAASDSLDEDNEKFYVALGPDASRGVGLLYNNKASVALTDDDSPSTDTSLSSLSLFAGQSHTLSPTQAAQSRTVAYEVTEATLTATAARGTAMAMGASFGGNSLDLDGRGATSIEVIGEQESAAVPLAVGTTTVTLTVTAEDGTTTGTHAVSITRSALGAGVDTVAVSVPSFTLTCPAEVVKNANAQCTLRASGSADWPVVAVIHSSADGDARALVAEDPIIPDTDPAYSKDVSLGNQQPARTAFNRGYGELFSGGSHTLYRTYGFEKFDWSGTASAGNTRTVTIQVHDSGTSSGVAAEVFYVALAPSGYTGLSDLVDNKVPILIKSLTAVTGVAAQNVTSGSADVVVEARNPSGMLYLRYRTGTSGPWTEAEEEVTSSPARISITGLAADTEYQVQASFDDGFSTGMMSGSFTTLAGPAVTGVEVVSDGGDDDTYALGEVISVQVAFNEAVDVVGSPTLGIDMDPAEWGRKEAVYASGSGTAELVFTHTVIEPNYSKRGIAVLADTLALAGGTIRSASSQTDADLAHSGLDHDSSHKVSWLRLPSDSNGNWAPVFDGTAGRSINAPPGILVSIPLDKSDFWDPDGDELTFEMSESRDDVYGGEGVSYNERIGRVFFQAKTACAILELNPAPGEVYETVVTMTATDPDGESAQGSVVFRTDPAAYGCPSGWGAAVDGTELVISFNRGLAPSLNRPTAAEFAVKVDGAAVSVTGVDERSRHAAIILELASPVGWGQTVTVSYAPGDSPIAPAFADHPVVNKAPLPDPMVLTCGPVEPYDAVNKRWTRVEPPLGSTGNPYVPGSLVVGHCSTSGHEGAPTYSLSGDDADMFEISAEGELSFAVATDYEAPADSNGDNVYEVSVTATVGVLGPTVDLAVAVTDGQEAEVINIVITAPTCVPVPEGTTAPTCAAVSGNDLIVTFSGDLAAIDSATADALRFAFFVDGAFHNGQPVKNQSAGRVAVSGDTLTLTLGTAVSAGDEVTVRYFASSVDSNLEAADGTAIPDFELTVTTTAQT